MNSARNKNKNRQMKRTSMNESEILKIVSQKIQEFEGFAEIQPSSEWNSSVMQKLSTSKQQPKTTYKTVSLAAAFLFLVLINFGYLGKLMNQKVEKDMSRNSELNIISKEVLIIKH
jgi:hypothetical protein